MSRGLISASRNTKRVEHLLDECRSSLRWVFRRCGESMTGSTGASGDLDALQFVGFSFNSSPICLLLSCFHHEVQRKKIRWEYIWIFISSPPCLGAPKTATVYSQHPRFTCSWGQKEKAKMQRKKKAVYILQINPRTQRSHFSAQM